MKVQEFLKKGSIIVDLQGRHRAEVLAEMATRIADVDGVSRAEVLRVLEEREKLGSTGIGDGVAIPHGSLAALPRLVSLFARSKQGVEFDAIDGKPTHLFFVLLTPDNNMGLKALARVSKLMRRPEFRTDLVQLDELEALYAAIVAEDARL